ncbi:hypothetical protein GUJ93_ZPchr0010g8687 [Zizania palustris]|uniref:RRM domain-containing protein n=1 Tax=Zizania palustris TaxID=103762 RepID=A0A8J5WBW9_ZIZPA|nr:hypothetical protein GUJ93_ZPchr0010g8687 [Zizania palustris]
MRKKNACEVLVGGLPRDAVEEDVAQALVEAGDVEEVQLVRDLVEPRFNKGLPRDAVEEDVAQALAEAGDVEEVQLVRDLVEPRFNKGFVFVRFAAA